MPFPNDHAKLLTELLRMAGGEGAELLRRWSAALLMAPAAERRAIVEAVEARIVELYAAESPLVDGEEEERLLHIESEPKKREGFTEVIVRSFAAKAADEAKPPAARSKKRRA